MLVAVATAFDPKPPSGAFGGAPAEASGPDAFVAVVRRVVAAVMRLPASHPDVDDGVSETMRRALEGRDRLRDGDPMRPWVLGIARHVAVDALRKKGRERPATVPTERDSSGDVSIFDVIPDSSPSPLEMTEAAEKKARVHRAMAGLPEGMREALMLFHVEGLGYEAIAREMNVPLGTVATWIARGRKTLTERILSEERSGR
ncbi:MAG: RNA polymerase sigma factor [Polyangiaceae bacterium]